MSIVTSTLLASISPIVTGLVLQFKHKSSVAVVTAVISI